MIRMRSTSATATPSAAALPTTTRPAAALKLAPLPLAAVLALSGCSALDRLTGQGAYADPARFELPAGDAAAKAVVNGESVDLSGATAFCTGSDELATLTAETGDATIVIGVKNTGSPTVASVTLGDVGGHTMGWMASFPGSASAQRTGATYTVTGTAKNPEDPVAYKIATTCPGGK